MEKVEREGMPEVEFGVGPVLKAVLKVELGFPGREGRVYIGGSVEEWLAFRAQGILQKTQCKFQESGDCRILTQLNFSGV